MHDFVLVREYRSQDKAQCEELVKNYLMECSREAFMTVLFKEVSKCDLNKIHLLTLSLADYPPVDDPDLCLDVHLLRYAPAGVLVCHSCRPVFHIPVRVHRLL